MLTVFEGANGYPISNDDYYIRELASGLDEVVFHMSIRDPMFKYIVEEARIRDRDQNYYLIKQIDAGNKDAKIVAQIDIDAFKSAMFENYTNNSATVFNTVLSVLPAGWNCIDHSGVTIRRTIPTSDNARDYNVTAWKVLQDCCNTYKVRFRFDNVNKIVYIVNPATYTNLGAYATRDLNLKELNFKGKSTDFVTRLYAEGADGLTFADINGGKNYVDNNTYSNKVVSAYWKDERYEDADSLLADAIEKLKALAVPSRSYDCDVLDLANTNPDMYGFEDFSLFNIITLIDDAQERRLDYQIVERWNYPYYPVQNKVVLSTETPKIQNQVVSLIDAVSSPTSTFQQMMQSAIANSTALITGNKGGYVVFHDTDNDDIPDEILIMDTPDISTATKVWRWNKNGLGYSNSGYNGQYGLAMTIDGSIVADYITAGQLNGEIIRAGSLNADAMTLVAQEQLGTIHSFVPYDWATNSSRWAYNAKQAGFYTYAVGNENVPCVDLAATTISSYNPNYQTQFNTDFCGKASIHVEVWFNLWITYQTGGVIADQQFMYLWYPDTNGVWHEQEVLRVSGEYTIQSSDREWDKMNVLSADIELAYECDITKGTPKIGLRFVAASDVEVFKLIAYSYKGDFVNNSLTFNANGLESIVQSGNIISTINQSAEAVTIEASKINLTGDLSLRGDFKSYNENDNTTYAFLDDGKLSFFLEGSNVFTISSDAVYGNYAGIFFGDPQDFGRYTTINQQRVQTPQVYVKGDGRYETQANDTFYGLVSEMTMYTDKIWASNLVVGGRTGQSSNYDYYHNAIQFNSNVFNSSGSTVFVSDRRKKKNIKDLAIDKAKSFIMALKPKEFKFKKDISTSNRKHHGFIAQEVKEAMYEDWGAYVEDKEHDFIGLRYDELLADMVTVIQDQERRIEALERRLKNDKSDD